MTSIIFSSNQTKIDVHKRMMEYYNDNAIDEDENVVGEETFANHLLDVKEFGKVLTPEEQLEMLSN
jgi:hypothetical protein